MMNKRLSWSDVTIRQYIRCQEIINNPSMTDETKMLEILPVFYPEIDPQEVPMVDVISRLGEIRRVLDTEIKPRRMERGYRVGDYDCAVSSIDSLTVSQFSDYQAVCDRASDADLCDILSCVIVPKCHKYNDGTYDIEDFKTALGDLCIEIVPTVLANFQKRLRKL